MKSKFTFLAFMLFISVCGNAQVRLLGMEDNEHKASLSYTADGKLYELIINIIDDGMNEYLYFRHNYQPNEVTTYLYDGPEQAADNFPYITRISKLENGRVATDEFKRFTSNAVYFTVNYSYDGNGNMSQARFNVNEDKFVFDLTWTDGNISNIDVSANGAKAGNIKFEYNNQEFNNDIAAIISPLTALTSFCKTIAAGPIMAGNYGNQCKNYMTKMIVNLPENLLDDEFVEDFESEDYTYEFDQSGLPIAILGDKEEDNTKLIWGLPTSISKNIAEGNSTTTYYNIEGKRLAQPKRGLNIIRQTNGKSKKVMMK